jgi:hypothetical protein
LTGLVLLGIGASARGQGVVPGGWDSEVGSQPFAAVGAGAGFSSAFGMAGFSTVPAVGSLGGMTVPRGVAPPTFYWAPAAPQTANALLPFAEAVRRSGRRRLSR